MKTTIEYLDAAKKALSVESDYEMARKLGIQKQAMSNYRTRIRTIDDYTAAKIAEALGLDPMEVIAAANAEREKDGKRREYWRQIGAKVVAAGLMLVFLGFNFNSLASTEKTVTRIMGSARYLRCLGI